MATFKRQGKLEYYHELLVNGMAERGYDRAFAERCFKQIEGFGYYGFPESHAASFALQVYVSAWLKCHYPDVFCAAILNSQPMGFYAPAQLVRDAVDHGVEARPPDVNHSFWDATLEPVSRRRGPLKTAVRLGFRSIKGMAEDEGLRIEAARIKPYATIQSLKRRAGINRKSLEHLAEADAFRSIGLDRRQALWSVHEIKDHEPPLFAWADEAAPMGSNMGPILSGDEPWLELPQMTLGEQVIEDYASLRMSLRAHPMALLRARLPRQPLVTARDLWSVDPGRQVALAGLVLIRQRPGSAKGVVFMTLEDETGFANCVVWPDMFKRYRALIMTARLMLVQGYVQREGKVIHIITRKLDDWTQRFSALRQDFVEAGLTIDPRILDGIMSRADEFKNEPRDLRAANHEGKRPTLGQPNSVLPEGRNFR